MAITITENDPPLNITGTLHYNITYKEIQQQAQWFVYYSVISSSVMVLICLIGMVANGISIAVFLSEGFRRVSINVLLLALSIVDLLLLLFSIPLISSGLLVEFYNELPALELIYIYSTVSIYPLTTIFQSSAIWLLMAITFERWVAVCRPLLVSIYCSRKRAVIAIFTVAICSFLFNICRFWEFEVVEGNKVRFNLRKEPFYMLWYVTVSNTIFIYIIPLVLLTTFNILIILQMIRARRDRRRMAVRQNDDHQTGKMLLYVMMVFIACHSTLFILNVMETMDHEMFQTNVGLVLNDLNNLLVCIHASITFVFYFNFSTRYNRRVKQIVNSCFCWTTLDEPIQTPARATAYGQHSASPITGSPSSSRVRCRSGSPLITTDNTLSSNRSISNISCDDRENVIHLELEERTHLLCPSRNSPGPARSVSKISVL